MPDDRGKVAWVFADKLGAGQCKASTCGASITWAEFVKSGKKCPFDGELVGLRTGRDAATGRPTMLVNLETSHYATCPEARNFSQPGRKPTAGGVSTVRASQARQECEAALDALRSIYRSENPVDGDTAIKGAGESLKRAITALGGQVAQPRARRTA
jgi:hypothetical protein